jgi:hypothetical protein
VTHIARRRRRHDGVGVTVVLDGAGGAAEAALEMLLDDGRRDGAQRGQQRNDQDRGTRANGSAV